MNTIVYKRAKELIKRSQKCRTIPAQDTHRIIRKKRKNRKGRLNSTRIRKSNPGAVVLKLVWNALPNKKHAWVGVSVATGLVYWLSSFVGPRVHCG